MNNFKNTLIASALLAIVIFSLDPLLNHHTTNVSFKNTKTKVEKLKITPHNNQIQFSSLKTNDTISELSALLSGNTAYTYKIFKTYIKDSSYLEITKVFLKDWKLLEDNRLKHVSAFSSTYLNSKIKPKQILYPFSGPDLLFAQHFFNTAKSFFLIGLEPCGTIPNFLKAKNPDFSKLHSYMRQLYISINDIVHFSFFRTLDMNAELKQNNLDGTLHVLLFFLGKLKCTPIQLRYFEINNLGHLAYSTLPKNGVEITFINTFKDTCNVRYLSANIDNQNFNDQSHLYTYLNASHYDIAYLKGASYLLHNDAFSNFRSLLINRLPAILQDDTGIPFQYFQLSDWELSLYGNYTKPIRLFKNRYQKDLDSLYKKSNPIPLGFGLGYNFKNQNSALIFAQKKH
jgi:hypothetical protein